ncbi:polysaccharide deacetylase family protein [Sphaerisporangium sp. TRM90804]|uniref:polysaccharide deacetylase family protein n=1 Tax=Sphaerisporangium sp. TRM90804 TaxID=3031113 RepID=UPI002446C3A3|nr:polysaccharide deacetylase family protein [Sphaerisporangium sp. TRM90804]MDH2428957.1 polysaccharide deacetylase family protein [Sphaerisporangium sp. TRM90804]
MSRSRLSGGIALLVAVSAACGISLPSSRPREPATLPAQPTTINFVDPSTVTGLSVRTVSGESRVPHLYVSHPVLAAAPELNAAVERATSAAVRGYLAPKAGAKAAERAGELNIDGQLTAASASVYGVRVRTGRYDGKSWRNSLTTYWYDAAARRVHDSAGLLKDDAALASLSALVKDRLRRLAPAVRTEAVLPRRALFDSLNFNPHGDLVAEFDDGQVGPARMGRIAVAVPRDRAAALLSDFGRRTRDAVDAATPSSMPRTPPSVPVDDGETRESPPGGCAVAKCVALTFDDGPGPATGSLLAILSQFGAHATFFATGESARAQPGMVERISAAGNLVGNHSWSHRDLTTLDDHQISDGLGRAQMAIATATRRTPPLLRAPYGHVSARVLTVAHRLGLAIAGWNVDTSDWRDRDPAAVARRAVAGARPGSIILMHDTGPATVAALPLVLKGLEARGYTCVTLTELPDSSGRAPGTVPERPKPLPAVPQRTGADVPEPD